MARLFDLELLMSDRIISFTPGRSGIMSRIYNNNERLGDARLLMSSTYCPEMRFSMLERAFPLAMFDSIVC